MSDRVWIAGVGMTRFGVHTHHTNHDLARSAVRDAFADAGGASVGDVDVAFFATAGHGFLEGQVAISGQIALRHMGFESIPVYNVENACASGASAFNLAVTQIKAGEADVALAVGAEKMHVGDIDKTMSFFDTGYDVSDRQSLERTLHAVGGEVDEPDLGRRSIFMDIYAAMARNHMRIFGTTQTQIAAVAAKNHAHAVANERAHYRKAMDVEQVLGHRRLSHPLTVPMCAPVTDGAAAVVLCSDEGLARLGADRPVRVLASVIGTGTERDITNFDGHITQHVAKRAYDRSGVGPGDVDVAEVHDATAFAEVLQTEMLGLVPIGEGGAAAERGVTSIGGTVPVNPSGGLESKGHPIGATGLGQVFELTEQLRGRAGARQVEGARVALAENGGGFHRGEEAVASVIILKGA